MSLDDRRAEHVRRCASGIALPILLALGGLLLPPEAGAIDVRGSAEVSTGTTDVDGDRTDLLDQQYALELSQTLTDYLRFRLGYHHLEVERDTAGDGFDRRSRQPRFELSYNRPRLWGALSWQDQLSDGSTGDFETSSLLGRLSYQATERTVLSLRYRDETNTADVAVFGRETDTRQATVEALRRGDWWSVGSSYQRFDLQNRLSGLESTQDRWEGWLDASRTLLDGRLTLAFDTRLTQLERSSEIPRGAVLAEPLPALGGLAAVDPSPLEGTLDPAPDLVDGDFDTAALPPIEIGGAFTFRNVGVDVGLLRPADQLEVSVDAPSDPALAWRVFHSADNLVWEEVPGVSVEWDGDLLRYVLRFPVTTDRFFKAVNITVNAAIDVQVTEVRALISVDPDAVAPFTDQDSTYYRADLSARFRPHERVTGGVDVGGSRDEGTGGGIVRRDFEDRHASARLNVDLPADLLLHGSYRWVDLEDRVDPVLLRTEETTTVRLGWDPLDTLEAGLTWSLRDELEVDTLLRSTETWRLRADAVILPDLVLESQVEVSDVDEPFAGRNREVFAWNEILEASPTRNLRVGGGFSYTRIESSTEQAEFESRDLRLRVNWQATRYLSLGGNWTVSDINERQSVRQSYNLAYNPGRLTLSLGYQELDDEELRVVESGSAAAIYRVNDQFNLFANYSFSGFEETLGTDREITSLRVGVRLYF